MDWVLNQVDDFGFTAEDEKCPLLPLLSTLKKACELEDDFWLQNYLKITEKGVDISII